MKRLTHSTSAALSRYVRSNCLLSDISRPQRRCIADKPFAINDIVLLRQAQTQDPLVVLSKPLQPGQRINTHRGTISHDEIIGKRVRDTVTLKSNDGNVSGDWRCNVVSLDDYVRLTRRLVTPIYPPDANLIVSLLDLHPDTGSDSDNHQGESPVFQPQIQILEAGTGHGALTLHLGRAIHAANCAAPLPSSALPSSKDDINQDWVAWKAQRRAIVHSVEFSPTYASHAEKVVRGFRHGMYARNVDFHVGDVSEWLQQRETPRSTSSEEAPSASQTPDHGESPSFLTHAFLDLPNADRHVSAVARALCADGSLIVFNPSISQITECAAYIREHRIPLELDRVVELGLNGASGGREWDVRFVKPRASQTPSVTTQNNSSEQSTGAISESDLHSRDTLDRVGRGVESEKSRGTLQQPGWATVCRPKVGERINGGGFLGVWKRHRDRVPT